MPTKSRFLRVPVEPFAVTPDLAVGEMLARMERVSFQGRNLATARRIWEKMLGDDCTIFLGMAGALSAGGMRLIVAHLIEHRYVDCLVSTGANLYHDLHETRGRRHYVGSPRENDAALQADHIDRVYDTYASEDEFVDNDEWIAAFVLTLERRPYTSREFLYRLGEHLWKETGRDGILTAAYRATVPIFCPAIADSSIGMGLSQARHRDPAAGHIDVIGDIIESANLVIRHPRTASVVLGGGTPKNFINQASVQAEFYDDRVGGHRYALQIVTDVPHFGGASGSSLEEARSWGKLATDAEQVTVHADATIALPLLVSALAGSARETLAARKPLRFDLSGPVMAVERPSFSSRAFRGPRRSMNFPFEYDHGAPLAFGGALPEPRSFDDAQVVILPGAGRSHHVLRRRHAQRAARDSAGLVAHGVVGRGDRRRRPRRRHLHAAGDGAAVRRAGAADGRDPARRVRDRSPRQVPGHARRRALDHAAAGRRRRGIPGTVGAADRRARRPARLLHGHAAQPRVRDAPDAWSTRRSRRSASAACRPKRPQAAAAASTRRSSTTSRCAKNPNWIERVVETLAEHVYITIDVDGMDPAIMPATGTPEPGGLSWYEMLGPAARRHRAARPSSAATSSS